jgi:large conductance mechanosensitive channel
MERLRALLAHGGVAMLAALFAVAFATYGLAQSLAQSAVGALQQHLVDEESGGSGFSFSVAGTKFELYYVVQAGLALVIVAGFLFFVWRVTRRSSRECPSCHSQIPLAASVCRYCTAELVEPPSS